MARARLLDQSNCHLTAQRSARVQPTQLLQHRQSPSRFPPLPVLLRLPPPPLRSMP